MPVIETHSPPSAISASAAEPGSTCAVCPHRVGAHDPIGIRYCSATAEHELDRKCVCVGNSLDATTENN